jgi:carotenoid phi-ring synthase / carotenoid chi-ring synthase
MIGRRRAGWLPGSDARAVRHPARPGRLQVEFEDHRPRVVVIGGGIAGLAAATGLAERGVRVVLVEREDQLGGRVRSWPVGNDHDQPIGRRTMSRGFHAFFRQYYNLRALLRRADPALGSLRPLSDYPLIHADGHRDSFANIPRTPPLNLATFVAVSPSFRARDLARVDVAAALELLDVSFPDTFAGYDGQSAAEFLDRLRFPAAARHLALEVFARSFFADPQTFSAGELVAMFHSYFLGSSEGLLFDVPCDDYDSVLWAPLAAHLDRLGVEIRTGLAAEHIATTAESSIGGFRVSLRTGPELAADAVILATDPGTIRQLGTEADLGDTTDPASAAWCRRLDGIEMAPAFAVWRLWLDRKVAADRPAFLGTSGYGPMDNVSVLERFEAGASRWSERHGGSVVELHAYALPPDCRPDDVRSELRAGLQRVYPETAGAKALAEEWLVAADCPLIGTGAWHLRPEVSTPHPRLLLAGDGVRCDFPVALMERAATTGFLAANALLNEFRLAGHDLWTVPMQSRHRLARPLHQLLNRNRADG